MGADAAPAVPELRLLTHRDEDGATRKAAAHALGCIGKAAATALPEPLNGKWGSCLVHMKRGRI